MSVKKVLRSCTAIALSVSLMAGLQFPSSQEANAELVSGEKFLGNVIASKIPAGFSTYWNQVTPENASKWGPVEETRDKMNWANVDLIYDFCKTNKYPFKFHTLVWGSQEPTWMTSIPAAEKKEEVLEWMDAAAEKYADADFVDVVNEPLHQPPSFKDAIGGNGSTGWDWVIWSFQEARKRFKGKLLINEYGIISDPGAASNYVNIIKLLKDRNLVDGIGIQCHQFNMDNVSTSTMKSVLNTLAATGLPIYVSELDMTGDDATQLARYKEKFPVLWEHASVKGITLWGYIEGTTWKEQTHLITTRNAERPALTWLRDYLKSPVTPLPTFTPTPTPTPDLTQRDAMSIIQAEDYSTVSAATIEKSVNEDGTVNIGYITNGNYVTYSNVDFGTAGSTLFRARVASGSQSTTNIEVRLNSDTGTLLGTLYVNSTGGWNVYTESSTGINKVTGVNKIVLKFTGPVNLDWFTFSATAKPTVGPTVTPTSMPTPTPAVKTPDLNGDKVVNMADVILVATAFGAVSGDSKFNAAYDLTDDGVINMADVIVVGKKFGQTIA
jgi:endo-1,4-beta-xylanase